MKQNGLLILFGLCLALGACRPKTATPDLDSQVAAAVAATIAAMPTCTPHPIPTPYPAPTPMELTGLFCEYGFCFGHPEYLTPFDLNAATVDNRIPSTFAGGKLVAYGTDMLLLFIWQADVTDLQYMLGVVSQATNGSLTGSVDVRMIGPYNVLYQPVQPPPDSTLLYGGAAAWQCGRRAFAWLIYTAQDGTAPGLLENTLARFACGE